MEQQAHAIPTIQVAALEQMTGPNRGKSVWLNGPDLKIWLNENHQLQVAVTGSEAVGHTPIASLRCEDGTYVLNALGTAPLWVNKAPVSTVKLHDRDIVEFGDFGPMSRFRLYSDEKPARKLVTDILTDSFSYLKVSRQPVSRRLYRMVNALVKRLTLETTILFRLGVVAAILILAAVSFEQIQINTLLRQQIQRGASQIESVAQALARARSEALSQADLKQLSNELENRLSANAERLSSLERRTDASSRVIAEATPSVLFLQGAYGFRESSSGRLMRHVVDADGKPLISPFGQPMLTLDGEGPVAERQFTGTGFIIGTDGTLISNRHLAVPWENDATIAVLRTQGLEPQMIKQIAYMPGRKSATAVELVRVSDDADLAILRLQEVPDGITGLQLSATPPMPGVEVIVLGFPTGLRSMLAQSGKAFVEELQKDKDIEFWSIARQLAGRGYIAPLASRGIVSQVSRETIVYDADTTHGGSGGPVLDIDGAVIAVTSAILPEYGGSNLGVPIAKVKALLDATGPQ
ncbi:MAG: trypsin-like peptidase domain-containing protein [Rhodospirillales bacterium]|nr:trypsin-like peptidase domain-containing protein [Rhodospirillales bacterium]